MLWTWKANRGGYPLQYSREIPVDNELESPRQAKRNVDDFVAVAGGRGSNSLPGQFFSRLLNCLRSFLALRLGREAQAFESRGHQQHDGCPVLRALLSSPKT